MLNLTRILKNLREEAELSINELARKSGLSAAFISKIENGQKYQSLSLDTCKKLSEGLGISLKSFLEYIGILEENGQKSSTILSQALRSNGYTDSEAKQVTDYAEFIKKRKSRTENI